MRTRLLAAAVAATSAALLLTPLSASAGGHGGGASTPIPSVVSSDAITPFNIAFGKHHSVLVADGAKSAVTKLAADGTLPAYISDVPGASGVAVGKKSLAYTMTVTNFETFENTASGLYIRSRSGTVFADTHAYETANNPDQVTSYGIADPTQCQTDALASVGAPVSYPGQVDSHAYSVAAWGKKYVVADAGANALFVVNAKGQIKTLTVFPAQVATVNQALVDSLELPAGVDGSCLIGAKYGFEPVPTDVEVGKDGYLYVTLLPGGPESPAAGARGSLWKVNPWSGNAWRIAGGFAGATNLAIGKHGTIYVAELFGGQISVVKNRKVKPYLSLPGVVAVETAPDGSLWAATMANEDPAAPGTVVKISKGHSAYDK